MDDALLTAAKLCRDQRRPIVVVVVLSTVAGVAYGVGTPRRVRQRAVVAAAAAEDGPIESLESVSLRLEQSVAYRVLGGEFERSAKVEITPVVGPPPQQERTTLLRVEASADGSETTNALIKFVGRSIIDAQKPILDDERARLHEYARSVSENLSIVSKQKATYDNSEVYLALLKELSKTLRGASPARLAEPMFVATYPPETDGLLRSVGTPAILGLLLGAVLGFLAATVRSAMQAASRCTSSPSRGGPDT